MHAHDCRTFAILAHATLFGQHIEYRCFCNLDPFLNVPPRFQNNKSRQHDAVASVHKRTHTTTGLASTTTPRRKTIHIFIISERIIGRDNFSRNDSHFISEHVKIILNSCGNSSLKKQNVINERRYSQPDASNISLPEVLHHLHHLTKSQNTSPTIQTERYRSIQQSFLLVDTHSGPLRSSYNIWQVDLALSGSTPPRSSHIRQHPHPVKQSPLQAKIEDTIVFSFFVEIRFFVRISLFRRTLFFGRKSEKMKKLLLRNQLWSSYDIALK